MRFEKLDDNKIKIILNIKDLEEKNIDLHSFMSNSIETQKLFVDLLKEAEIKVGFVTNNYNIHIETFATSEGNFIFNITRMSVANYSQKKKIIYKRKTKNANKNFAIYSFDNFDDYCNFCSFLNKHYTNLDSFFKNTTLILYDSTYYLVLFTSSIDKILLQPFFSYITEFANLCYTSDLFLNKLLEHGEKIIPNDAIGIGIRYFG